MRKLTNAIKNFFKLFKKRKGSKVEKSKIADSFKKIWNTN